MILRQQIVTCRIGFLSLRQRLGSSLVIVIGMSCVAGVSLAVLSLSAGLARTIVAGAMADNAIVLPIDAQVDYTDELSRSAIGTIMNAPGIANGPDGNPLASAETITYLPPAEGFAEGSLILRGIGTAGTALRPQFSIIAGRMFRKGLQELIVGRAAEAVFGFKVGTKLILPNGEWPIVGEFSANGSTTESELLADADTVSSARRTTGYGSVLVALTGPAAFETFKQWLAANPALSVQAQRQSDYLARSAYGLTRFFAMLAYIVGCMMAAAALLGSVQIMYSAVEARTIEIGTLRAIGYSPAPIASSVILETVFLSMIGAMAGSAIAWAVFNKMRAIGGGAIFELHISVPMILFVLSAAAILAVIGGFLPALRAARLPVVEALRST
ncbi:MAG TPA: FtsX-like permease family protein [Steroidobacteraceae bacterium]|jgi:putative ABC transport system permease protein|nr:FtsX-like permease family protein [Steroidobacteraceae bacterium]